MREMRDVEERRAEPSRSRSLLNRLAIYAGVIVGAFLLGFVPMWMIAEGRETERDEARRELRLSRIQNRLASAAIDARRGEYEPARVAAGDFYNEVRAELVRESDSALTAQQRASVEGLLTDQNDVITVLARSDPASADRLSNLYAQFARAVERPAASSPAQQPPAR
jgi:hypothetical protein